MGLSTLIWSKHSHLEWSTKLLILCCTQVFKFEKQNKTKFLSPIKTWTCRCKLLLLLYFLSQRNIPFSTWLSLRHNSYQQKHKSLGHILIYWGFSQKHYLIFCQHERFLFGMCCICPTLLKTCEDKCLDCGDDMGVCARPTHHNVNIEYVQFFFYQLYLNKA